MSRPCRLFKWNNIHERRQTLTHNGKHIQVVESRGAGDRVSTGFNGEGVWWHLPVWTVVESIRLYSETVHAHLKGILMRRGLLLTHTETELVSGPVPLSLVPWLPLSLFTILSIKKSTSDSNKTKVFNKDNDNYIPQNLRFEAKLDFNTRPVINWLYKQTTFFCC